MSDNDATAFPAIPKGVDLVSCGPVNGGRGWGCDVYKRGDRLDLPSWYGEGKTIPDALRDAFREREPGVTEIVMRFEP